METNGLCGYHTTSLPSTAGMNATLSGKDHTGGRLPHSLLLITHPTDIHNLQWLTHIHTRVEDCSKSHYNF